MNGGVGFTGQSPCAAWMSVWQSPEVSTRTRISCAPGTGFGTRLTTRGFVKSSTTAAVISPVAGASSSRSCSVVAMVLSFRARLLDGRLLGGRSTSRWSSLSHLHISELRSHPEMRVFALRVYADYGWLHARPHAGASRGRRRSHVGALPRSAAPADRGARR